MFRLRLGPKFEGLSSNLQWDDSTSLVTSIHVYSEQLNKPSMNGKSEAIWRLAFI